MIYERLRTGVDFSSGIEVKRAIRYHAEQDRTWKHHDLALTLYRWSDLLVETLIDPIARPGVARMPSPIIGFDKTDIRTLAYYTLGKNPTGVDDEIIFNEQHLDRPLYSILEILCHEEWHLWQQRKGEHPYKSGHNTHNKEFVDKCEAIGLHPTPIFGYHWKPADGAFEALLKRDGIAKPDFKPIADPKKDKRNWWDTTRPKGRSTLTKYSCPECHLNVRQLMRNIMVAWRRRRDEDHHRRGPTAIATPRTVTRTLRGFLFLR